MPLIPDGQYKIHNVQFPNPPQVADLVNGGPGPIDGRTDYQAHNDKWCIKNKYQQPTSNEVTIENVEHRGIYAYAETVSGSSVVGQPNDVGHAMVWTLVARGDGKYNIQSPNNTLIWQLTAPNQNIKVITYPAPNPNTQWTFERVGGC